MTCAQRWSLSLKGITIARELEEGTYKVTLEDHQGGSWGEITMATFLPLPMD